MPLLASGPLATDVDIEVLINSNYIVMRTIQ